MSEESPEIVTFESLDLSESMLATLASIGYEMPSPVQAGLIPKVFEDIDVMAQARTGTGKTASFGIPLIEMLNPREEVGGVQVLVLVPTRELCVQVCDELKKLAQGERVVCVAVYGGTPIRQQIARLQKGADIVVGTPGRTIDLLGRKALDLSKLYTVVLDEADRMLDIGFRPDIEKILRQCPKDRQTLLLSATVPPPVEQLARKYMHDPIILNFSPDVAADTIEQHYFTVDAIRKFDLLLLLLEREKPKQAIIFCRTRRGTEKVFQRLSKKMRNVDAIHGDMQQRVRDRVMRKFRAGESKILVATDVVGRGIDVSGISHIINYDMPDSCDDYVHRVGRTGRMGQEGVAYSFVMPDEGDKLTGIEIRVNRLLIQDEFEGFKAYKRSSRQDEDTGIGAIQRFGFGVSNPQPAVSSDKSKASGEDKTPPPGHRPKKRHRRAL